MSPFRPPLKCNESQERERGDQKGGASRALRPAPRGERLARPRPRPRRAGAGPGRGARRGRQRLRPGLGGPRPASVALKGGGGAAECVSARTPARERPGRRARGPCVCFTAASAAQPARGPAGVPGGSSRRAARGVGVHPGSSRFFFPKGEAVDLKRHFKGSSILI